jgi:DNA-binding transcriptional ArsR family regulator
VVADERAVLDALGDPTRRAVFELLAVRPSSVEALARQLPVSRPAVSQHLRVLRDAQLVTSRADGTRRIYTVDPEGLAAARLYFQRFWTTAMANFADKADLPPEEQK